MAAAAAVPAAVRTLDADPALLAGAEQQPVRQNQQAGLVDEDVLRQGAGVADRQAAVDEHRLGDGSGVVPVARLEHVDRWFGLSVRGRWANRDLGW